MTDLPLVPPVPSGPAPLPSQPVAPPEGSVCRCLSHFRGYVAESFREEGRREGRAEVMAEVMAEAQVAERARLVSYILAWRGVAVTEEARERIDACRDLEVLGTWFDRAITASAVDELFEHRD
ncbi:hypothetical protein [Streptomyces sp. NPDC056061]|uniref:hypothetical protein n=1 Tax=Streptomyces sp. NPDC056061 TaxID=3345700 RepID=UPI0035E0B8B5